MFTTCTKPHVNPTPFSILASDDLQITFKMFAIQCLLHVHKPHVNPTPFSILASDDLQITFKMFATQCLIHVPKHHLNPTTFSNLTSNDLHKFCYMYQASGKSNPVQHFGLGCPSNDLQFFCHSMFNTCTKHHLNPTPLAI